ncbi:MarR family winged helix-turn-helix transcriptional regulator [Thermodesulfobacteriota bacterium]
MVKSIIKNEDYRLWVLMRLTRDAMAKSREKELRRYGISSRESAVLFIIQAVGDKPTPAEISRWMFREQHSVSTLLNRMEKKGLIKKTKDLDRKNMVRVSLTDKGRQTFDKSSQTESIHRLLSVLSKKEYKQLFSILGILRDRALEDLAIEYKPPFP